MELDELPDNSSIFDIPCFPKPSVKEPPSVSAQLGKPILVNAGHAQATYEKATPRVALFAFNQDTQHEIVTFIFNYQPEGD